MGQDESGKPGRRPWETWWGLFRVLPSSVLLPVHGGGDCCFLGELLLSIMKKMSSWLAVSCMGFSLDLRLL